MESSARYDYLKPSNPIGTAVALSVAAHAALIMVFLLWPTSNHAMPSDSNKIIIARLVKLGKPPDAKSLPRIDSPAYAPESPPATFDKNASKPDKLSKKDEKSRRDEFSKKMDASIERMKKKMDRTTGRNEIGTGSPDGSPDGDSLTATEGDQYLTRIHNSIMSNYTIPSILTETDKKTLHSTIIIYLDDAGNLQKMEFEKRSGNIHFDNALESAVKKASPFPPPPKDRRKTYRDLGIGLNFSI